MKHFQKILFTIAMTIGLSLSAMAQKDEPKKPPPKGETPVVIPKTKNPKPKETPKPQKPDKPDNSEFAIVSNKFDGFETA